MASSDGRLQEEKEFRTKDLGSCSSLRPGAKGEAVERQTSLRVEKEGDDSGEGGNSGGDATTGDDGEAGEVTIRMPTGARRISVFHLAL